MNPKKEVYITPKPRGPRAPNLLGGGDNPSKTPSRNALVEALRGGGSAEQPDALKTFQRASEAEQARRGAVVLREARRLFRAKSYPTLVDCIAAAGHGGIEAEYARRILRVVLHEWNLLAWSEAPYRARTEVYRALDAAIRKAEARRGGWSVHGRAA